ncbi:MAG: penicillin-binding protein [Clostridia bacterium]|nr:penicillin-binding protein [Clostridia bacterium]
MKKIRKISKIIFISLAIVFSLTIISAVSFYHISTHGITLDTEKLNNVANKTFKIYDKFQEEINLKNKATVDINELSANTKNAFISAEDKRFYSHNGVDYIRVGGALLSNLKSKSFSEGASTISQQLIKNTLLSNEKTIKRKLKEVKLARALEKNYSKDKILEMYLNNIYFGNGNYGIENASIYYFGKSAKNLTTAESALLAGTINAPNIYNIQNNTEKAIERRNLILNLMKSQNKISNEEYEKSINESVNLNITKVPNNNYMFNEILEEACNILNITENELNYKDIEIFTNYDSTLSNNISELANKYKNLSDYNIASIVIDNETNTIIAVYGNSKTLSSKKQPGSTIKPILVYAPALEENLITPTTKILDEEININGYSPANADNKFHGFVTVRECLKNSYNIPSVKLLNELGVETGKNFASKLGINFSENDNHLALSLGGFSSGTTLKQLADAYSTFANSGYFSPSKYITKIKLNDKIIYSKNNSKNKVMKESTANQITDMLIDTSKSGTAKKLKNFNYQIASKTGTVGKSNSTNNTDAYSISYTSNHTVITYIGDENLPKNISGSSYPTEINKEIFKKLYSSKKPKNFEISKNLNQEILNNLKTTSVSKIELSTKNLTALNLENRKPILMFFASKNNTYNIIRKHKNKEEIISSLNNLKNDKYIKFEDISAKNNEIYEYFIEICEKSTTKKYYSNSIKLKSF